jgi:hypothetical protein
VGVPGREKIELEDLVGGVRLPSISASRGSCWSIRPHADRGSSPQLSCRGAKEEGEGEDSEIFILREVRRGREGRGGDLPPGRGTGGISSGIHTIEDSFQ